MTQKTDDGQRDVISCDTPAEVIGALLRNLGGAASLDQIGQVGIACYCSRDTMKVK